MSTWNVFYPEEPSIYEQHIGHRLTGDTPVGAGEYFVHPDDCEACKDPETHRRVKDAEERIERGLKELSEFFDDDVPADLLLNIGMSFYFYLSNP